MKPRYRVQAQGLRWGVYDTLPVPATLIEGGFFKRTAAEREAKEYNRLDRETKGDRLETDGIDGTGEWLPW